MKKIESFKIDHTRLKRGIYVSRRDHVGSEVIATFDLRLKEPNNEPALEAAAAHTIEHIGATFLRNHPEFAARIIYFGPMGCLTGFYLLLRGNYASPDIVPLMTELFKAIAEFDDAIPGATPIECGNYRLMDLEGARREGKKYLEEVLERIGEENLVYPA
ncbi:MULTISPECIES: S-ribosylhomocysteine lyase [Desulfosediminicola]|uniref:S-ribosylhomocysteine lyase n=1 Tax=Desulfosediminicola TaxID=2886823 RepID=UPI0010AD0966|nr:S-ribosylhomocysteine lyase [Desulfosediminicola ganghwensis]